MPLKRIFATPKLIPIGIIFVLSLVPFLWTSGYLVGGDDSRLYYIFPYEYFINYTLYNVIDNSLGSLGYYFPKAYLSGFALAVAFVKKIFSGTNVQSAMYSINLFVGGIYCMKFCKLLIENDSSNAEYASLVGSLFYIFSTFTIYTLWWNQLHVIYLIAIFPAVIYYFMKGLCENSSYHIILAAVIISVFSFAIMATPWFLGLVISVTPICIAMSSRDFGSAFRKFLLFILLFVLLNLYWLFDIVNAIYNSSAVAGNLASDIGSNEFIKSGENTIRAVASHNTLLYPLLGLFHESIQKNFGWQTYEVFTHWNKKFLFVNALFLIPILYTTVFLRKLEKEKRKIFIASIFSFVLTLYLFTAKFGDLGIELFVWMNNTLPGFVMFKNMYDKFSIAMAFSYAIILSLSLYIIFEKFNYRLKAKKTITSALVLLILLNAKPFITGELYQKPVWTTKETYNSITKLNNDFMELVEYVKDIETDSKFLWLPLNEANYAIISDEYRPKNYYMGVSPLHFLTGKLDFNGKLSFPDIDAHVIKNSLEKRDYKAFGETIKKYNIGYVIVNYDINTDIQNSYYYKDLWALQQTDLYDNILGSEIKKFGNRYALYSLNKSYLNKWIHLSSDPNSPPGTFPNVTYKRLSSDKFSVNLSGFSGDFNLIFAEPFNKLWQLRLNGCDGYNENASPSGLFNTWTISSSKLMTICKLANSDLVNGDKYDLSFDIVFQPSRISLGSAIVSFCVLLLSLVYLICKKIRQLAQLLS